MPKIAAYGNNHSFTSLGPLTVERREVGAEDVQIDILYCGVCHSDIHQARNEWLNTNYPCVPGHEWQSDAWLTRVFTAIHVRRGWSNIAKVLTDAP